MQRSGSWIAIFLIVSGSLSGCAGGRTAGVRPGSDALPADLTQLRAAVLRAEDRRVADESLSSAMRHDDPGLRAVAVRALGRIGEASSRPSIEQALKDPDPQVRSEAAVALGLLGGPDSLRKLIRAAGDDSPLVRARIAWALGAIADGDGVDTLVTLLGDDSADVAAAAGFAAGRLPEGSAIVDPLIAATRSPDPALAFAAAFAVSRLSSRAGAFDFTTQTRVRELMMEWAGIPSAAARQLAARGLMIPSGDAQATVLGKLTVDPDPAVRMEAVRSFSFVGAPVEPFLSKTVEDEDPRVVLGTLLGLGRMRGGDVSMTLVSFLGQGKPSWLEAKAVEMIPAVDAELGSRIANGISREETEDVRLASVALVEGRTDEWSLEIAQRLFEDPNPTIRQAAIPALALGSESLAELYGELWQSEDPGVQSALARAAGIRRDLEGRSPEELAETEEKLRELWDRGGSSFEVARAVLAAAGRGPGSPAIRSVLELGLEAADPYLRRLAAREFERLFDEDRAAQVGAAAEEPPAHYAEVLAWAGSPRAAVVTVERAGSPPAKFTLRLDTDAAPLTCWNFARLAQEGYFDGMEIRNLVPNRALQIGDPRGDGTGGPGYTIRDELGAKRFRAGTVAMIRPERDSAGSRWFVALSDAPQFEGEYTAFGNVVRNLDGVVSRVLPADRVVSIRIYEGDGTEPISADGD